MERYGCTIEKDNSIKQGTSHQDLNYLRNEMTPHLILHKKEYCKYDVGILSLTQFP